MSIVVTGCAGFIGSHICRRYLLLGYKVYGIDNLLTGTQKNIDELRLNERFSFLNMSVTDNWHELTETVQRDTYKPFKVFHFASPAAPDHYQKFQLETLWANSIGLKNALEFADNFSAQLVFASTSEVYGDPAVSPQHEDYWGYVNSFGARSCYDEAKRFGEALIFSHNKIHNTRHGIVRIFNTYGPNMNIADGRVVTNFIRQALAGIDITVYGDGNQTRSFCYISDLISALEKYAELHISVPVNIGNDEELTIIELAQIIISKTGSNSKIEFKPLPIDDPKTRRPDLATAKKLLAPWTPEIGIHEGLEQLIQWMKN